MATFFKGRNIRYLGSGVGLKEHEKKGCRYKNQKKNVCWKCGQKKVGNKIDEKHYDQNKPGNGILHSLQHTRAQCNGISTYMIRKAYNKSDISVFEQNI